MRKLHSGVITIETWELAFWTKRKSSLLLQRGLHGCRPKQRHPALTQGSQPGSLVDRAVVDLVRCDAFRGGGGGFVGGFVGGRR